MNKATFRTHIIRNLLNRAFEDIIINDAVRADYFRNPDDTPSASLPFYLELCEILRKMKKGLVI